MNKLDQQKLVPINSDTSPMTEKEIQEYHKAIPDWTTIKVDSIPHLKRQYKFKNFTEALAFTNKVGEIAEEAGHHPLIELTWGQAVVDWWTHDIEGLHKNDFIMAAKTDQAYQNR
jgi:4a-hydroxytetrahydrobiopterin dehydratase